MRYVLLVVILGVYASVALAAPRQVTLGSTEDTLLVDLATVKSQTPEQLLLHACTLGLSRLGAAQQDQDATEAVEALGKQTPAQRREALQKLKEKK